MTIKIPQITIGDKILEMLGKKRGIILPNKQLLRRYGPNGIYIATKENFFKALFRRKGEELPEGMVEMSLLRRC